MRTSSAITRPNFRPSAVSRIPRHRPAAAGGIECLEARIAPAALAPIAPTSISKDGKTATFLQDDGYTLTVKTTKGKFTDANFKFVPTAEGALSGTLEMIDVSFATSGKAFQGAVITSKSQKVFFPGEQPAITVAKVGYLNATGVDLGGFYLYGDLGQVDAGDANFKTPGLGTLSVVSMGVYAETTQTPDAGSEYLKSTIVGRLNALIVSNGPQTKWSFLYDPPNAGNFSNVFLDVVADGNPVNDKYGSIGSILVENIVNRSLGPLIQPSDLSEESIPATQPTQFDANGFVTFAAGAIRASGRIGRAEIGGMHGGTGDYSGSVWSRTAIDIFRLSEKYAGVTIHGGTGDFSGSVIVGSPDGATSTVAKGIGSVTITSDLLGGEGDFSGSIYSESNIGNIRVAGIVNGNSGAKSGSIYALGNLGNVTLGILNGDSGDYSGSILARSVLSITAFTLNGGSSITGHNGVFLNGVLGSLTVSQLTSTAGDPTVFNGVANSAPEPGVIVAKGRFDATGKPLPGLAIGKITLPMRSVDQPAVMDHWTIAAGFGWDVDFANAQQGASVNPYASIGPVSIGGSVSHSAIVAGTLPGADGVFGADGSTDDLHMPGAPLPKVFASIASIVIKGPIAFSAFEAQQIGAFRLGATPVKLQPGPLNDLVVVGDQYSLREL